MRHVLFIALLVVLFSSCGNHRHHHVTRGIYYWKTDYRLSGYEDQLLKKAGCNTIYMRLFDVDWDYKAGRAMPVAPVHIASTDTAFHYVPVVFITLRTLTNINDTAITALAGNISGLAKQIAADARIQPSEMQIDCDWSARTKDKYFALLKALKTQEFFTGKTMSCTIRMHQVKYVQSTGIPPVDKGLLMCYNMGDIKKYGTQNSILDVDEEKDYLKYLSGYPLKMDVALPLFSWSLLFRDKQFKGIMRDLTPEQVQNNSSFVHDRENLYRCVKDNNWQGYYIKQGDVLRLETPDYKDIIRTAQYTSEHIMNDSVSVVLFHCDSLILSKYSQHELETIYHSYE